MSREALRVEVPTEPEPSALRALRRSLRADTGLMRVSNGRFAIRMLEQGAIWAVGCALVLATDSVALWLLGTVMIGVVYARNLEFVHECIHNTALEHRASNEVVGVLLALPMLTSFEDWKLSHLRHHADVRHEGFQFDLAGLRDWRGLVSHLLMLDHLRDVAVKIGRSLRPRRDGDGFSRGARRDYRLMAGAIAAAIVAGGVFQTWAPLLLWLIPLVPAAIVNFHIQLPEHLDCDTDQPDALRNSRTVKAGPFASWFVNNNNHHTSHHWLPNVPIQNLERISIEIDPHIVHTEQSYWSFYVRFYSRVLGRSKL